MKRVFWCAVALAVSCGPTAGDILKTTGVKGGLVVRIGRGDPTGLVALRANDSYLVHGLDTEATDVAKAREYIRSKRLCGKVRYYSGRRTDG